MQNPKIITTEVFKALCTPLINSVIPGTNFKNLNDLKTRRTLKIKKKLRFDNERSKTQEINAGIDNKTKKQSSLFQFEEKYPFTLNSNILTIISIMKTIVIILSALVIKFT